MSDYRDKLASVGVLSRGRTRDIIREGRDKHGDRTKATTDQLGNTVTEHNNSKDQVDVNIRAPHIRFAGETKEIRDGI
jgi:predicted methyltransferase MtxX (methanogen marker protein 4)